MKPKYRKLQDHLESLPATGTEQEIKVEGEKGLVLRIGKTGHKVFYYFYTDTENKRRKHKIGVFDPTGVDGYWLERAAAKVDDLRVNFRNGIDPRKEKLNGKKQGVLVLRNFLDQEYYPYIEVEHRAHRRTKQIMEWNFDCFMNTRIDKITNRDMDKWQRLKKEGRLKGEGLDQPHGGKPSAPATINRASGVLVAAISKAVEWKLIEINQIKGRKKLKTPRTAGKFMTDDEIGRIYNVLDNKKGYFRVLIRLLLNTGLRPKEAFTQTWDTIDFENRKIIVLDKYAKNGTERKVPLNETIYRMLKAWKEQKVHDVYVFPNPTKTAPLTRVQKSWEKLLKDAELPHYRLYDCRHSFASKLANTGGIPLKVVSDLLGHSSIAMTEIYSHEDKDKMAMAVSTLG